MKGLKRNRKIVIVLILGIVLTATGVYAATTIMGSNVTYSNIKSGLSSTNVQAAIDELYEKAKNHCPKGYICKKGNIVEGFVYNQEIGASNYCVTGEESTCIKQYVMKIK